MQCRHCGKPIYEPEWGAGYFHVEIPKYAHRAEPDKRFNTQPIKGEK